MVYLVAALAVVVLLYAFAGRADAARSKKQLKSFAGLVVLAVLALLMVRGGLSWLAVALGGVWGVIRVLSPLLRMSTLFGRTPGAFPRPGDSGDSNRGAESHRRPVLSRGEALEVLGLKEGATAQEIQAAYKALIRKVHPDQGGSAYLAKQLNLAKQVLLG